jgi:co-chaperonin GroES (HSP10)
MEVIDKRKFTSDGETLANAYATAQAERDALGYDDFNCTLEGFEPLFDAVLLRILKLEEKGLIASPDAFAQPTLFGEVISVGKSSVASEALKAGDVVRFLDCVGVTFEFTDGLEGHQYRIIRAQDSLGKWGSK